jgi:hypothetical protein
MHIPAVVFLGKKYVDIFLTVFCSVFYAVMLTNLDNLMSYTVTDCYICFYKY